MTGAHFAGDASQLRRQAARIELEPNCPGESRLVNLLAENESEPDPQGRHHIVLEPFGYRWYRVGGLNYAIRRIKM